MTLPTLHPIDTKPLQEAMAMLRSLPEYNGETMEQAEANTVAVLHDRGVPVPTDETPHERVSRLRSELDDVNRTVQRCVKRKDQIIQQLLELERE